MENWTFLIKHSSRNSFYCDDILLSIVHGTELNDMNVRRENRHLNFRNISFVFIWTCWKGGNGFGMRKKCWNDENWHFYFLFFYPFLDCLFHFFLSNCNKPSRHGRDTVWSSQKEFTWTWGGHVKNYAFISCGILFSDSDSFSIISSSELRSSSHKVFGRKNNKDSNS